MKERGSSYLRHVDGLRCVAVMAVLLFHFGVPGLGGGYVGVDVFFVISGYLITGIIAREVTATGRFDFGNFYARRIRRIFPALLATLAATTMLAIASLTPADLVAFGKSLLASAVSLSNFLFWSESGYFDAASKTKPLLHTWSLSVEEQFYVLWPAFLYLCGRLGGRKGLFWGIALAGAASFLANYKAVSAGGIGYQSDLFFLPHFRVFEFAIGGLGSFLVAKTLLPRWARETAMVVGLGLIIWSIVHLREGVVFPYANALAPCLGTLLVILANDSRIAGRLLTNRLAVWGGRISYSLYLVHWPIVVFVDQYLPTLSWWGKFVLMAGLSLLAAVVLHYGIEARFRHGGTVANSNGRRLLTGVLVSALVLGSAGMAVASSSGMPWRYRYFTPGSFSQATNAASTDAGTSEPPFLPLDAAAIDAGKTRRFEDLANACRIDLLSDAARCHRERPSQVLIFGNSHEPDAFNAFNRIYGKDTRVNLINFGTANDCAIAIGSSGISSPTQSSGCAARFQILNDRDFLDHIDVIVYNAHQGFDPVARDLWAVLEAVQARNPKIHIVAIGSYLQTKMECAALYNKYRSSTACKRPEFVDYHYPNEREITTVPQVKTLDYLYISKYRLLCGGDKLESCTTFANGELAFYDQHHLSRGMAWYLGERIAQVHRADLARIGLSVPGGME